MTDLLVPLTHGCDGAALVCIPPAGAGAGFFTAWPQFGRQLWAVRLPGRESTFGQPYCPDLETAAGLVAEAIAGFDDVILFGHCFGAFVAYETALRAVVTTVVVSGEGPPDLGVEPESAVAAQSDEQLLDELRRTGSLPESATNHPGLAKILLPTLRADAGLAESYLSRPHDQPLDVPIIAVAGRANARVSEERLLAWEKFTTAGFELTWVDNASLAAAEPAGQLLGRLGERPRTRP